MMVNVFWFCIMSLLTMFNMYAGQTFAGAVSFIDALLWLWIIFDDRGGRCS